MQPDTYFNTTGLSGTDLEKACEDSKKQNELILIIFKECATDKYISPFYVKAVMDARTGKNHLLTSVRRGISTLCKRGLLLKSERATLKGAYGSANHGWKAAG